MRGFRLFFSLLVGLVVACPALARSQVQGLEWPSPMPETGPNQAPMRSAPVFGQPFSAISTYDSLRVLGDGTKIEHHTATLIRRDASGRERTDFVRANDDVTFTTVTDLEKLTQVSWNSKSKIAVLRHLPDLPVPESKELTASKPGETRSVWIGPAGQRQKMEMSALEPRLLEGMETRGTHVVKFVPTGKDGNDRDMVTTIDSWYSPILRVAMLTEITDPAVGHSLFRFSSLKREQQPSELFMPPSGYKLVEGKSGAK